MLHPQPVSPHKDTQVFFLQNLTKNQIFFCGNVNLAFSTPQPPRPQEVRLPPLRDLPGGRALRQEQEQQLRPFQDRQRHLAPPQPQVRGEEGQGARVNQVRNGPVFLATYLIENSTFPLLKSLVISFYYINRTDVEGSPEVPKDATK